MINMDMRFFLFSLPFFSISALLILLTGTYGWDDGAITLAYAKTLSETGAFALTASSQVVEGTSSISWTLIFAIINKILAPDFGEIILYSQFAALFFSIVTAYLLFSYLRSIQIDKLTSLTLVSLLMFLPYFFAEQLNGMEMTAFSAVLLAFCIAVEKGAIKSAVLISVACLLTRFESIYYLSFALFFLILFKINRADNIKILFGIIFVFSMLEMLRLFLFDDILPNTIWAKMNYPYTPYDSVSRLRAKLGGLRNFISIFLPFLVVFFIFWRMRLLRLNIYLLMVVAFFSFAFVAGDNWGYKGRMFVALLPIILILLLKSAAEKNLIRYVLVAIFAVHILSMGVYKHVAKTSLIGANNQGYLSGEISDFVNQLDVKEFNNENWYGVTPENYKNTGLMIDEIRAKLNFDVIIFMAPDVGGLGLCCERIKVVDSALLTNKFLARNGYKLFSDYLESVGPDIIETHGVWSEASKIYNSDFFLKNYSPVAYKETLLFVRNDLVPKIKISGSFLNTSQSGKLRYGGLPIDASALEKNWQGILLI